MLIYNIASGGMSVYKERVLYVYSFSHAAYYTFIVTEKIVIHIYSDFKIYIFL